MKNSNSFSKPRFGPFTAIVLVCAILFSGCRKDVVQEASYVEYLNAEELENLDKSQTVTNLTADHILLPNGQSAEAFLSNMDSAYYSEWHKTGGTLYDKVGPTNSKNILIGRICNAAYYYCNRSRFNFPDEGEGKPAQNGLAYVYGSRDIDQRRVGYTSRCRESLYGVDCSGFVDLICRTAGFHIGNLKATDEIIPSNIESAIHRDIPELRKCKVEALGQIPSSEMQSGDFVAWIHPGSKTYHHIGMVVRDDQGNLFVSMSSGDPNYSCSQNKALSRGPVIKNIDDKYWFRNSNENYTVCRINADLSGNWDFHFRCSGNTSDFIVHHLTFPTAYSSDFVLRNDFTDTDGSPNRAVFNFNYNRETNVLSCVCITTDGWLPDFERRDEFSIVLTDDNIEYFDMANRYIHNGQGCITAVSLRNLN
ncbi:MAG: NlpC/P60 family protein [Chitinophagales bacterium]